MEQTLAFIMALTFITHLFVSIYITLLAFQKSASWGFACFLAGIGVFAFIVEHWKEYRSLFFVYTFSLAILTICGLILVVKHI